MSFLATFRNLCWDSAVNGYAGDNMQRLAFCSMDCSISWTSSFWLQVWWRFPSVFVSWPSVQSMRKLFFAASWADIKPTMSVNFAHSLKGHKRPICSTQTLFSWPSSKLCLGLKKLVCMCSAHVFSFGALNPPSVQDPKHFCGELPF